MDGGPNVTFGKLELLKLPEPISKKSCPVALQVEILIVIVAFSSFCKPTLRVTTVVALTTVLTIPAGVNGKLISECIRSSIVIVPKPTWSV